MRIDYGNALDWYRMLYTGSVVVVLLQAVLLIMLAFRIEQVSQELELLKGSSFVPVESEHTEKVIPLDADPDPVQTSGSLNAGAFFEITNRRSLREAKTTSDVSFHTVKSPGPASIASQNVVVTNFEEQLAAR